MLTTPTNATLDVAAHKNSASVPRATARYRSLDAWRGAACAGVVLYHLRPLEGQYPTDTLLYQVPYYGFLGVPIFFVISGYCIAATAASTLERGGATIEYFFRRFRRIYPPYLLLFAVAALLKTDTIRVILPSSIRSLAAGSAGSATMSSSQWWGNATLTESWRYLAFGGPRRYLLEHSWTLCYEEQFYFLFGLFLLFAGRRFYTATLLLSLPILGWQFASATSAEQFDGAFFDGRWLMFAAGVFVHWHLNQATGRSRWIAPASFLAITAALPLTVRPWILPLRIEFFAATAFCLLLLACYRYDDRLTRSRFLAPLRYCGQICFSLYLTHWFVVYAINAYTVRTFPTLSTTQFLLKIVGGVLASVSVGSLYYYAVEKRCLNSPQTGTLPDQKAAV